MIFKITRFTHNIIDVVIRFALITQYSHVRIKISLVAPYQYYYSYYLTIIIIIIIIIVIIIITIMGQEETQPETQLTTSSPATLERHIPPEYCSRQSLVNRIVVTSGSGHPPEATG